jgi:thymidylate synthase (FAD)
MADIAELIGKQIPVLDKGWLELQDMMGNDLAIVNAARVSFLGESKGSEQDKKLLMYLLRHRHTSPFEQVEFKFRVHAPLVVWWQWVRHRTWNFNAQSGRYVEFEEDDFHAPQAWRKQSKSNKQGSEGLIDPAEAAQLTEALLAHYDHSFALYQRALAAGVAKEQARLFLPGFSIYYTWVAKTDAHNLMHFLSLRMAPDAQYEIRAYAQAIYEHFFKPALPWTAEAFETYIYPKD